jgi:phage terminase small subunit
MAKTLTPQQQKFVTEYLRSGNAKEATLIAGYSEKSARSMSYQLLKIPIIMAEIKKAQDTIQSEGVYNLKKALADADDAYEMARLKKNSAGMTAAATLKAKLSGLMIDRSEVKQVGFSIIIEGYDTES